MRLHGRGARAGDANSGSSVVRLACLYNVMPVTYKCDTVANTHVMTVSQNGQFSIPAETRARWKSRRVIVVDLGDRVVMRPLGEEPIGELEGKYRSRGPGTQRARRQARAEDAPRPRSR